MTKEELNDFDRWLFECMGAFDRKNSDEFGVNFWVVPNDEQAGEPKEIREGIK